MIGKIVEKLWWTFLFYWLSAANVKHSSNRAHWLKKSVIINEKPLAKNKISKYFID